MVIYLECPWYILLCISVHLYILARCILPWDVLTGRRCLGRRGVCTVVCFIFGKCTEIFTPVFSEKGRHAAESKKIHKLQKRKEHIFRFDRSSWQNTVYLGLHVQYVSVFTWMCPSVVVFTFCCGLFGFIWIITCSSFPFLRIK